MCLVSLFICKTSIAKSSEAIVTMQVKSKPFDQRQFHSWKSARLFIMSQRFRIQVPLGSRIKEVLIIKSILISFNPSNKGCSKILTHGVVLSTIRMNVAAPNKCANIAIS